MILDEIKRHKFLTFLVALTMFLTFMAYELGYIRNIFKTIDPSDPNFNPNLFRPQDYYEIPDRQAAFRKVVPKGTPMKEAEAAIWRCCTPDEIRSHDPDLRYQPSAVVAKLYIYRPWFYMLPTLMSFDRFFWRIIIHYDKDGKVVNAAIHGP